MEPTCSNNRLNHDVSTDNLCNEDVCNEEVFDKTFSCFNLSVKLLEVIKLLGFTRPSPIQYKGMPPGLQGKDLIVQSKSGTGKTLLFILVILSKIESSGLSVIIAPTRELVVQINQEILKFTGLLDHSIKTLYSTAGKSLKKDKKCILQGCKIVVSTPGRILALLKSIEKMGCTITLVLDEVDMLMDEQFETQIVFVISKIFSNETQLIATSATLLPQFADKLNNLLPNRELLSVSTCLPFVRHSKCEIEPPVLRGIKFCFIKLSQYEKCKFKSLLYVLESLTFKQAIIFCNKSKDAINAFNNLNNLGYYCNYTSSKISHSGRMRCLNNLRNNSCKIFICSDLLSRGIDSLMVDLVINFDIPFDKQTFLHRSGRAARFGKRGICVCIASYDEWLSLDYFRMSLKLSSIYPLSELATKGTNNYLSKSRFELPIHSFHACSTNNDVDEFEFNLDSNSLFEGIVELGKSPFITIYNSKGKIELNFMATSVKWRVDTEFDDVDKFDLTFECEPTKQSPESQLINKIFVSGAFTPSILLVKLLLDDKIPNINDAYFNSKLYDMLHGNKLSTNLDYTQVNNKSIDAFANSNAADALVANAAMGYYGTNGFTKMGTCSEIYFKFMCLHFTQKLSQVI